MVTINCEFVLYADDTSLLWKCTPLSLLLKFGSLAKYFRLYFNKLEKWFTVNGLKLNQNKKQFMQFINGTTKLITIKNQEMKAKIRTMVPRVEAVIKAKISRIQQHRRARKEEVG